jgi:preprotein translocase subunit SecD
MTRVLLFVMILSAAFVAQADDQPRLHVYIVTQEAGAGLHMADFAAFPKLGYIADKPDLTISQLEGVSFGVSMARPAGSTEKPKEDRRSLVLRLTTKDAEALKQLTSKHLGARLLMLLNDDPLFAPVIRTPSAGESVYITPPLGSDTEKLKARLETLVHEPG